LILTTLVIAAQAMAQSTFGTLVGTIRDPSGSVVAEAVVSATNSGTSAKRSVVTDKEGGYVLVNMEPGTYQLDIQAPGFQVITVKAVELTARETVRTDGILSVAGQAQSVSVNAEREG
jgi:hypothetical protein